MQELAIEINRGAGCAANSLSKLVNLYYAAPQALKVEVTGDFNHWHPTAMQRLGEGWWFTSIQLCCGHHRYRVLVDGKLMLDPWALDIAPADSW
jgi:1,4-alpha-glucan branching enzyme